MNASVNKTSMRKVMLRMLGGAVVGAAATGLFLAFVAEPLLDLEDPATMVGIVAGVSYLLIGLLTLLGLYAPRIGARYLNVEDADEIREEGPKLKPAVLVFVLTGVFLLILTMAGADPSLIRGEAALAAAMGCLIGITFFGWISSKKSDELTRQMGLEVSSLTIQFGTLLLCGWAALAQFGYVEWMGPLAFVSGLALVQLFASFVIITRKGLLVR